MAGHEIGLLFRKGWVSRRIFSTVMLLVVGDALVKYEYGITVKPDFSSTKWEWWLDKVNKEKGLKR